LGAAKALTMHTRGGGALSELSDGCGFALFFDFVLQALPAYGSFRGSDALASFGSSAFYACTVVSAVPMLSVYLNCLPTGCLLTPVEKF
jgi:hypothetical protein